MGESYGHFGEDGAEKNIQKMAKSVGKVLFIPEETHAKIKLKVEMSISSPLVPGL